jgi:hypothetical protein
VAKATLARPGLLLSVQLGPELVPVNYVSGELGWNNPSKEVIKEFEAEWKHEGILCFASIGTGHQGSMQVKASSAPDALNSTAEKMVTDCQRVAEEIAHRFQRHNNYFRLSVEQGLQLADGQKALRLEDVTIHTKAYLDSTWTNISVDRLVGSLIRADEVLPWQTTRENFEETMKSYLSNAQSCAERIEMDEIKQGILEAGSILELIRVRVLSKMRNHGLHVGKNVDSNEEEWLGLAKAVDSHSTTLVREIVPKIWEPYSDDPLWPSANKYFM